ncbi:hypothetical protein C5612_15680 [Pseudomonas frederiksbergensis]|uniref:Uncharacterized protein n=1 Tax=Pseudomonas frederiksbergensis TaxID=104087 RepID=A0A2S8HL87_9PSED|nr:hypothetical protein C5612_15680 [Pseudomonas frederiksbergensis]
MLVFGFFYSIEQSLLVVAGQVGHSLVAWALSQPLFLSWPATTLRIDRQGMNQKSLVKKIR